MFNICNIIDNIYRIKERFYSINSHIALIWNKDSNKEWKSRVENWVNEIRDLSDKEEWYFVPGNSNPADIPTRDLNIPAFENNMWSWQGPLYINSVENHPTSFEYSIDS